MGKNLIEQVQVVTTRTEFRPGQGVTQMALFDEAGEPLELGSEFSLTPAEAVEDVDTADATDEATAIALVNELKDKTNELLSSLRDAGLLAE
jgi:hypothetical protein